MLETHFEEQENASARGASRKLSCALFAAVQSPAAVGMRENSKVKASNAHYIKTDLKRQLTLGAVNVINARERREKFSAHTGWLGWGWRGRKEAGRSEVAQAPNLICRPPESC